MNPRELFPLDWPFVSYSARELTTTSSIPLAHCSPFDTLAVVHLLLLPSPTLHQYPFFLLCLLFNLLRTLCIDRKDTVNYNQCRALQTLCDRLILRRDSTQPSGPFRFFSPIVLERFLPRPPQLRLQDERSIDRTSSHDAVLPDKETISRERSKEKRMQFRELSTIPSPFSYPRFLPIRSAP